MGLLRQVTKHILTACVPRNRLLTQGPRSAAGETPRLALTFDDGPHPVHTPELLDTLRTCGAIGTFFVVGKDAERYPDLIRRISEEGHELGNHTWSHSEPERTSPRTFLAEVRRTDELIENLTGQTPTKMRPPRGELNVHKLIGLWRMRKTVALWNVDPRDYRMQRADDVSAWCRNYSPHDGDVVLFHDNHPWVSVAIRELIVRKVFEQFRTVDLSTLVGQHRSIHLQLGPI